MEQKLSDDESLANDRLRGVPAIAAFLGETERRTRYLIERKLIPHGKEGAAIVASKRRLRERHERLTAGETS